MLNVTCAVGPSTTCHRKPLRRTETKSSSRSVDGLRSDGGFEGRLRCRPSAFMCMYIYMTNAEGLDLGL